MINKESKIKIYSTSWCGPCVSAKRLLTERGFSFDEIDIEERGMSVSYTHLTLPTKA